MTFALPLKWHILAPALLLWPTLGGCPDDGKRPIGATCDSDSQCANGVCIAQMCLDPEGDEDQDGLVNRIEAALGSNPLVADSDGDGVADGAEVGVDLANPTDVDGDGKLDALESNAADGDGDCIADQFDPDDAAPETDPAALARFLCPTVGACAVTDPGGTVVATCTNGVASCDFSAVTGYESPEVACDGIDNDCDGVTDERHAAGGEIVFDGGPSAADAGKVLAATCGTGACAGGTVVCGADQATLVCSSGDHVGPLACDSDMDCDGLADEGEVANPITQPLAGCSDFYADADTDGYGAGAGRCLCAPFGDYQVDNHDDCAEADPLRFPTAAGICGADADCDLRLEDGGEACDDGNSDVEDGCHECQAVARRIDARGFYQDSAAVSGLSSGGFVIAWDGGSDPRTEGPFGRSLAFFDAAGNVLVRYDDLGTGDRGYSPTTDLAPLPEGRVAVGAWRFSAAEGRWFYDVQHYDAAGQPEAKPATIYESAAPTSPVRLLALGGDALAWVTFDNTPNGSRLLIKYLDSDGDVRSVEGGRDLGMNSGDIDAIGFEDGSVVATWSDYLPEAGASVRFTQRFDNNGKPVADARRFEVPASEIVRARLVRRDGGWALFFLARRYVDQLTYYPVGYQAFEGDSALGPIVYLQQDDSDGCPYELAAGFDAAGFAWAVAADGECRSPLRGWYAGATTVRLAPLDLALHPDADPYGIVGAPSGPGFVLAFVVGSDALFPGLYVMRYGASAAPLYLP